MTTPECKARGGEDASDANTPAHELKTAMAGFVTDFKDFTSDIHTKLKEQDDRMTKFDRKSMTTGARPALATSASVEAPHQKAFEAYLRSGDDDALRGLELEGKALSSAVAADGGYLVDPQTSATVQSTLASTASIRAIANVVNVEATSYDVLIDHTEMGAGWATENDPTAETGTPQIDRITIPLHELSALPKASQRLQLNGCSVYLGQLFIYVVF